MNFASLILTFALISGQLIKIPVGGGGIILLDLVVLFLGVLGAFKIKFKLKRPPLFVKSAFIFIFVATLSLIFTPLNLQAGEYLISFLYTVRFFSYIFFGYMIYLGAWPNLNSDKIFVISGLTLAILGIVQFIFLPDLQFLSKFGWDPHYFRTASSFLDPNFLGGFLVLTLLLMLKYSKLFFAIVYITLLFTFSRGSYLSFLISFLAISILKKSYKIGAVAIILFLVLLSGFYTYQNKVATPRGIDREESASFRFSTWQQGFKIFSSHPILGIGFNTYRYALKEYDIADSDFLASRGSSTNDSSLLYVAATTGILGLFAFIFFLFTLIMTRNPILIAGLVGILVQSFFANTLFYPFNLIWIILISSRSAK